MVQNVSKNAHFSQKHSENLSENSPEFSGLTPKNALTIHGPLSAAWISDELLQRTRDVWSKLAGREVSADEAVEILINIKSLAEFLLNTKEEVPA